MEYQWVEISDPQTRKLFYANTVNGNCSWEKPQNVAIRPSGQLSQNGVEEIWELFDNNHQLPYYYSTQTQQTSWVRPTTGFIISLVALQKQPAAQPPSPVSPQVASSTSNGALGAAAAVAAPVAPTLSSSAPSVPVAPTLSNTTSTGRTSVSNVSSAAPSGSVTPAKKSLSAANPPVVSSGASSPPVSLPYNLKNDINQFKLEGFANKFFSTHKRGIFRKKVPVQQMVEFTKDAIPLPLMTINKSLQKDALKSFKLVQRIMGDRAAGTKAKGAAPGNSDDIQELLLGGINFGELRDEIYCQLLKQLTNNPKTESIYKGWELMSVLVVTFPSSKNFEGYLHKFIEDRLDDKDAKIQTFAKHSLVRLERICKKGPRGKVPTIPEIERAKDAPFKPSVFGESLTDIMLSQSEKHPDLKLPIIMTFLSDGILKLNGCATEGIFRVPGDADAVTELRVRLEKGQYDLSGITDASVPASLLKFWLRDLTDPLVPHELYDYCIKNAEDPTKALRIIDMIPEINKNVLLYLIGFLQIIGEQKNQAVTRMSVNNIAMVFAPNILRCPSDNLQVILENTKYEQAFVRSLVTHLKTDAVHTLK